MSDTLMFIFTAITALGTLGGAFVLIPTWLQYKKNTIAAMKEQERAIYVKDLQTANKFTAIEKSIMECQSMESKDKSERFNKMEKDLAMVKQDVEHEKDKTSTAIKNLEKSMGEHFKDIHELIDKIFEKLDKLEERK